jgi:hypothetical protein
VNGSRTSAPGNRFRRKQCFHNGKVFGGTIRRLTEQQNHNDDDEKEAAHAAANPDGTGQNR